MRSQDNGYNRAPTQSNKEADYIGVNGLPGPRSDTPNPGEPNQASSLSSLPGPSTSVPNPGELFNNIPTAFSGDVTTNRKNVGPVNPGAPTNPGGL